MMVDQCGIGIERWWW